MRLLFFLLMTPTVTGAQLRGKSGKVTTFAESLELVTTKTAYAVITFGVMYRERRKVMPARLLYRNHFLGGQKTITCTDFKHVRKLKKPYT